MPTGPSRIFVLTALTSLSLFAQVSPKAPAPARDVPPGATNSPAAVVWQPTIEAAFTLAKAQKKIVLWVIMKDEEVACKRMLEQVYPDAAVIAKCADVVVLPSSLYTHEAVKSVDATGKEVTSCPHFPGVTCKEHQAIEREMRSRFENENEVVAPQHIACDPDGRVLLRKRYELKSAELLEFLQEAQQKLNGDIAGAKAPAPDKAPGAGVPPPDTGVSGGPVSPELQRLLNLVKAGPEEERIAAAKDIAISGDQNATVALVNLLLGSELKPETLRPKIVRALGEPECAAAAKAMTKLFETKNTLLRNSTVVTLEEMESSTVVPEIVALFAVEKDPEIRKDCLRALGPAGRGQDDARNLLVKEAKSKDELLRMASYMALGSHLAGNAEVRTLLQERWKKDNANENLKAAILYAYYEAKDKDFAGDLEGFVKDERNHEIKDLADLIRMSLTGDFSGAPRGGGGGRGGFGRGGPQGTLRRALGRLFEKDKIERRRIREIRDRMGDRGR